MSRNYARQSPYVGACWLVFSRSRFLRLAVSHGMAENLDEEDQQKLARERGEVLLEQWENTYRSDYDNMRAAIRASL